MRARWIIALLCWLGLTGVAPAAPRVVVTIKPIHALMAGVMAGVGEPFLLVPAAASPHTFRPRPSDVRRLGEAQLLVWVGPALETQLATTLAAFAPRAHIMPLMDLPGLSPLPFRHGGAWGDDEDHGSEGAFNPHFWLDPQRAHLAAVAMGEALSRLDPANASRYAENVQALTTRLALLDETLAAHLKPVRQHPFLVFHDAYPYFEDRYGLTSVGAVALHPEQPPGARRLGEMRNLILQAGVVCLFHEPQFPTRMVHALSEGLPVASGWLDPLGVDLHPGPDLYFAMMERLAMNLSTCLAGGR